MPRVSVLMPVRNAEGYLARAIESVLGQSLADLELVIAIDRSTDRSEEIARRFAAADSRVVVMASPRPDLPAALNAAAGAARGALLARLDADDEALPDRLAVEAAFLDDHPDVVLVGSPATVIDDSGKETGRIKVACEDRVLRRQLMRRNPFVHSSVAMRAAAFRAAGGYREFPLVEDYDLWLRMAGQGRLANIDRPLVRYRRHGEGVSSRNARQQRLKRLLCLLAWMRDVALIDAAVAAAREADLVTCYARLEVLESEPSSFAKDDLALFRRLLPHVGSGDARAMVAAVAAAAKAGAVGTSTLAAFRVRAAASRVAFERNCRLGARYLSTHAGP